MLKKILNALSDISPLSAISTTKSIVEGRMREVEFGVLGRSLSCNPLTPRTFNAVKNQKIERVKSLKDIERIQKIYGQNPQNLTPNPTQNLGQNPQNLTPNSTQNLGQNLQNLTPNSTQNLGQNPQNPPNPPSQNAIIVDTTLQKNISLVADSRAYSPFLIIHKDIFISKYQILESLVYGADCVALSPIILPQSSLLELQNYAYHLGLEVAILADRKEHFKAEARIFVTKKKCLDSTPNNALIFTI